MYAQQQVYSDQTAFPALVTPLGIVGIIREPSFTDRLRDAFNPFGYSRRQAQRAAEKAYWVNQLISTTTTLTQAQANLANLRARNANPNQVYEAFIDSLCEGLRYKFNKIDMENSCHKEVLIPPVPIQPQATPVPVTP